MYELKSENGKVNVLLKTGDDFVKASILIEDANKIIQTGTLKKSNIENYPICINDEWYFEGNLKNPISKKRK